MTHKELPRKLRARICDQPYPPYLPTVGYLPPLMYIVYSTVWWCGWCVLFKILSNTSTVAKECHPPWSIERVNAVVVINVCFLLLLYCSAPRSLAGARVNGAKTLLLLLSSYYRYSVTFFLGSINIHIQYSSRRNISVYIDNLISHGWTTWWVYCIVL